MTLPILRETVHGAAVDDVEALDLAWASAPTFAFLPEKTSVAESWVASALDSLPASLASDHFALLTSGSTGHPKLVVGARRRAEALARVLHDVQASEPVEETILTLPLSYCYAFVNQWLWARTSGRRLVATRGFGTPDVLRAALDGATQAMLCLVGAQLPLIARHFPGAVFPGVIRVHFAGGRFPQDKLGDLAHLFPNARVFNNYGCAEAMPRLTIRTAADGRTAADVGRPIPGVELSLGAGGTLLFRSRYSAVAFVEDSRLEALEPGAWTPTGDLAQEGLDGRWELLGRANDVFKRYGEKIGLSSLLDTVERCWPGEAHFYREIDHMNEPGFVLLLAPAPADKDVRAILKAFRAGYPRTHWPLRVESVGRFPVLPNGKADLAALPSLGGKTVHWRNRI